MAKLYVFGIGGTGSRVLRSFTFLLGAGVKVKGFNEVVPIIIDADSTSGDKTDTVELMQHYVKIHEKEDHTENAFQDGFFATKMSSCCGNNFTMTIPGETSQRFKDYMNFRSFSETDQALVKMLFSEENLNSDMAVGFKGNPNIGSVVLNQFVALMDITDSQIRFSRVMLYLSSVLFLVVLAQAVSLFYFTISEETAEQFLMPTY